jgi:hypothetical protein
VGTASDPGATAILGQATDTTVAGAGIGVAGTTSSPGGIAVVGTASDTSAAGFTTGILGRIAGPNGFAINGVAADTTGTGFVIGVRGVAKGPSGNGVRGVAQHAAGTGGVFTNISAGCNASSTCHLLTAQTSPDNGNTFNDAFRVLGTGVVQAAAYQDLSGNPLAGVASVSATAPLSSSGGVNPSISLSGIVPIANGGTGSATQNFVDLTTNQNNIAGNKTFTGLLTGGTASFSNVGIGTATPGAKLDIAVNSGHIYEGDAGCFAGFTGIGFGSTPLSGCGNYSLLGQGTDTIINRPTNGVIDFRENNGSQVTIPHNGGLQINSTPNLTALAAYGTGFWTGYFENDSTNSTYALQSLYTNTAGTGYGMLGWTEGTGGYGVYGLANNASGVGTVGVYGSNGSANGTAGVFNNTAGGKILSGQASSTEVFSVDSTGNLFASGTGANTIVLPNDTVVGTFNNGLAKVTADNPSKAKTSIFGDKSGVIGIVVSGGGQAGSATIVVAGRAKCVFENAAVAGDYVTIGRVFNAECFDAGSVLPNGEQVVGRVLQSSAAGATLPVVIFGPEHRPNAGTVTSVTAGDVSVAIGGTAAAPTVAVAANGITNSKIADGALSPAKIAGTAATLSGANTFTVDQTIAANLIVSGAGTISGNGSGLTNINAQQLGGIAAANYARTDVGNNLTGVQNLGASGTVAISDNNEGTTGTTLNELAKLANVGAAIISAPGDTGGVLGIVVAGSGTTGQAQIAISGVASCDFDNLGQHAGDYVTISPTAAGKCHDAGAAFPTGTQVIGRAVFTSGGASDPVYLFGPEQHLSPAILSGYCTGTAPSSASNVALFNLGSKNLACADGLWTVAFPPVPTDGFLKNLQVVADTGGINASSGKVSVFIVHPDGTLNVSAITCTLGTAKSCSDTTDVRFVSAGDGVGISFTTQPGETLAGVRASINKF